jgi:hypothetical protein
MVPCYIKDEGKYKWETFNPAKCIELSCEKIEAKIFSSSENSWIEVNDEEYNSSLTYLCQEYKLAKWPIKNSKKVEQRVISPNIIYVLGDEVKQGKKSKSKLISENSRALFDFIEKREKMGGISRKQLFNTFNYKNYRQVLNNLISHDYVKIIKKE